MSKKFISVLMVTSLVLLLMIPVAVANTGSGSVTDSVYGGSTGSVTGSVYGSGSGSVTDTVYGGNTGGGTVTDTVYGGNTGGGTVTDSVYGDDTGSKGNKGSKDKNNKDKPKGISNALLHVKNPHARAVLQSILDRRNVTDSVYQYANSQNQEIDTNELETVASQVYEDSQVSGDNKSSALNLKYIAQVQIKAGKMSDARKYLEYSAQKNPQDENTFKELDRVHAKQNNMSVKVYINGKAPVFDVPPKIVDGRTMVPVRFIAEGLNANVSFNAETGTVTITGPDISMEMKINSTTAMVNGSEMKLDVPATIDNGRTMVPLRFIGEGFKSKVNFYGESNLISVTK